jgi:Na+-driven multidrug efflux pump
VPAFGVVGSAIASTIAYVFSFSALLALVLLAPAFKKYYLLHRFFRPDWRKFAEIFRLGLPMGSSLIFEAMLFNSATLIMATFGATAVAAHQVALNIPSLPSWCRSGSAWRQLFGWAWPSARAMRSAPGAPVTRRLWSAAGSWRSAAS